MSVEAGQEVPRTSEPPDGGQSIDEETSARLARLAGSVRDIDARLAELEREWDIERVLDASALVASGIGAGIAIARRRRLLSFNMPANVALLLLQHAVPGARPPLSLLRRLGFRTREDIERERAALVALRGPDAGPIPVQGALRPGLAGTIASAGRRVIGRGRRSGSPADL